MQIAIIGSRSFNDYNLLNNTLQKVLITHIYSGGALGADKLAEKYASEKNIPITIFKPEWNKYGKSAGAIRNKKIIEKSEVIFAFWDGKSAGTKISINLAIQQNKQLHIIYF